MWAWYQGKGCCCPEPQGNARTFEGNEKKIGHGSKEKGAVAQNRKEMPALMKEMRRELGMVARKRTLLPRTYDATALP